MNASKLSYLNALDTFAKANGASLSQQFFPSQPPGNFGLSFAWVRPGGSGPGPTDSVTAILMSPFGEPSVQGTFKVITPMPLQAYGYLLAQPQSILVWDGTGKDASGTYTRVGLGKGQLPTKQITVLGFLANASFKYPNWANQWQYCFAQVVNSSDATSSIGNDVSAASRQGGLDETFPYTTKPLNPRNGAMDDTPSAPLYSGGSVNGGFSYTTSLMCRPANDPAGIWIPLQQMTWSYSANVTWNGKAPPAVNPNGSGYTTKAEAVRDSNNALVPPISFDPKKPNYKYNPYFFVDTTVFPTWTSIYDTHYYHKK